MFLHHLKTSYRNLLKYKVQNVISTLCLAVGVVCFSITAHIMYNLGLELYLNQIDQGHIDISVCEGPEEEAKKLYDAGSWPENAKLDEAFFDQLHSLNLPAIKEQRGYAACIGQEFTFKDNTDTPKFCHAWLVAVSPRYLHYCMYNSAITGERLPEFKEGDLLITDDLSDQLFGKGTDPRGFTLTNELDGAQRTVCDVANITERLSAFQNCAILYVTKNFISWAPVKISGFGVEVAEGYTHEDVRQQLQSAFPQYYFLRQHRPFDWSDEGMLFVAFFLIVLFIGASVLIIGVMGFLKMELQLFSLRAREMALRRTMGAKPRHLFALLAVEVLIVFVVTALGALAITSVLADYAIPIIQRVQPGLDFDVDLIMRIEMWVTLATLVLALIIAFISVYRQLHAPVGLRVGRSNRPNTKGQSLMLGTQFVVSMLLTFIMLAALWVFSVVEKQELGDIVEDRAVYKGVLRANMYMCDNCIPEFKNRLALNENIDEVAYCIYSQCETMDNQRDESLVRNVLRYMNEDNTVKSYAYSFLSTSENLIDLLKVKITPNLPNDSTIHKHYSAVYVRTEQVDRLRKKWNLEVSNDVITRPLYKQRSYTLIGYAPALVGYRPGPSSTPSFWMVDEDIAWQDLTAFKELNAHSPDANYLIFPKEGKYNKAKDAIAEMYREALPGNMNEPPVHDLYDEWFKSIRMLELFRQLSLLLVIVSILCIVASVYSAIALESRGRQKEVALRKIHGAHTRDIILLFGKYYLRLLTISAVIVIILAAAVFATICTLDSDTGILSDLPTLVLYLVLAILIVAGITLLTISHKIWQVSKTHPAKIIKKE